MKTTFTVAALASLFCASVSAVHAQAQQQVQPVGEMGRVISTVPVIQQFATPTQVCGTQQVAVQQPKSGAGGLMGAIAGGAIGNSVGGGSGRALATMIGMIGGVAMGDNIEGAPAAQIQNVQSCTTQTTYENRTVGFNVVYEYAGKQYNVQMPQSPGSFIPLQVTPIGATTAQQPVQQPTYQQPIYQAPQQVAVPAPVIYAPAPVVVAAPYPYPYPYPYAYPYPRIYPNISFGFGFGGGYRHPHHHWR